MPIQFTNNIEKYMKSEKEKKRKIKEDDKNRNINQVNLSSIPRPSCAEADRYLKRWNEDENLLYSDVLLKKLFKETYPENTSVYEIFIKATALNSVYSTHVDSFYSVAQTILSLNIDERLRDGDETLVADMLSSLKETIEKEPFSFVTKYCSFHNPDAFPIYDSYIDKVLWHYKELENFSRYNRNDLDTKHDYSKFKIILADFRRWFGLGKYSTKELDEYLWQFGKDYFSKNKRVKADR